MLTKNDIAKFTWMWDDKFFLETEKGNFIWSDPDYNGDNTIVPFDGTYDEYLKQQNLDFGRSKGRHFISSYCGDQVVIKTRENDLPTRIYCQKDVPHANCTDS